MNSPSIFSRSFINLGSHKYRFVCIYRVYRVVYTPRGGSICASCFNTLTPDYEPFSPVYMYTISNPLLSESPISKPYIYRYIYIYKPYIYISPKKPITPKNPIYKPLYKPQTPYINPYNHPLLSKAKKLRLRWRQLARF